MKYGGSVVQNTTMFNKRKRDILQDKEMFHTKQQTQQHLCTTVLLTVSTQSE